MKHIRKSRDNKLPYINAELGDDAETIINNAQSVETVKYIALAKVFYRVQLPGKDSPQLYSKADLERELILNKREPIKEPAQAP